MLNKLFQNKTAVFLVALFLILLVLVRVFEKQLFYDPFLAYFKGDYMKLPLPEFDDLQLFLGLFFRYFLNAFFSLGVLFFLFNDKEMISFASILYLLLFVILIITFFSIVSIFKGDQNLLLFYVRRFLIQPLFLIVFVPAFYYQKLKK